MLRDDVAVGVLVPGWLQPVVGRADAALNEAKRAGRDRLITDAA